MPKLLHRLSKSLPFVFALLLMIGGLPSCASLPREANSADIRAEELVVHVDYMARPERGGRAPRSYGSWQVRKHIAARYQAAGLKPFGDAKGFDQKFIIGTNVVGVLPGSDPKLAHEFVVVTSHYDHLGKHDGEMHPGAADNAAGMAVLLEVAEHLSLAENRPRRSVVFAAFDCEETGLLGSFAFVARKDFDPERLAGVINIDMLGRDFMDVLERTLLVFGTENYPQLRQMVMTSSESAGINVLPLGRDLVGPRSDHAPFELFDKPWLFLTCGQYSDYHKPTDTPDKLNYHDMRRAGLMVSDVIRGLANVDTIEAPVQPAKGDREELQSIHTMLTHVMKAPATVGLKDADMKTLAALTGRANHMLAGGEYSVKDREAYTADVAEAILPILIGGGANQKRVDTLMVLRDVYQHAPRMALEGQRKLMQHILHHKPGIFRGAPPFKYEATEISDRTVQVVQTSKGRRLSVLVPHVEAQVNIGWFGKHDRKIGFATPVTGDCVGTTDELIDYALLRWTNSGGEPAADQAWPFALTQLTGENFGQNREAWMQWRLGDTGHTDEGQWVLSLLNSNNVGVLDEAVSMALWHCRAKAGPSLLEIAKKTELPTRVRTRVIRSISRHDGPDAMATLVDLLEDKSPALFRDVNPVFDEEYPFYHYGLARLTRKRLIERDSRPTVLADDALAQLEALTGEAFGPDLHMWQDWLARQATPLKFGAAN